MHADRDLSRHVKAVALAAPYASTYDYNHFDGVARYWFSAGDQTNNAALAQYGLTPESVLTEPDPERFVDARTDPEGNSDPAHLPERAGCHPENVRHLADPSGDLTRWFAERDSRRWVRRINAPLLMTQGHRDIAVRPLVQAGLFDQLP